MFEDYLADYQEYLKNRQQPMHKAIMKKAAKKLDLDAKHYASEAAKAKGPKKKHELIEKKEAASAAKDLKKRAKKAHEY